MSDFRNKKVAEFYDKFKHIQPHLEAQGIVVEKNKISKAINLYFGEVVESYYIISGVHTLLPEIDAINFRNKSRISNNNLEFFLEEFAKKANIPIFTREFHYNKSETFSETLSNVTPIILDINEEIMKYLARNPQYLYNLSSRKFEELVAHILKDFGFDVELTQATRDGGKDIIAYFKNEITSFLTYVECKKYSVENPVGVQIVRSVYGQQRISRANKSLIVTTSFFTKDAISLQREIINEMDLKDYNDLTRILSTYK